LLEIILWDWSATTRERSIASATSTPASTGSIFYRLEKRRSATCQHATDRPNSAGPDARRSRHYRVQRGASSADKSTILCPYS